MPNHEWFKCNMDAYFYKGSCIISIGCCVRNSNGEFVMAQTYWKQVNMSNP